jgi:hypothetical protein
MTPNLEDAHIYFPSLLLAAFFFASSIMVFDKGETSEPEPSYPLFIPLTFHRLAQHRKQDSIDLSIAMNACADAVSARNLLDLL